MIGLNCLHLLTQILTTEHIYWIVTTQKEARNTGLLFIAIPEQVPRKLEYSQITLGQLDRAGKTEVPANIWLANIFFPFQRQVHLENFVDGFPVETGKLDYNYDARDFLRELFKLKDCNLATCKNFVKSLYVPR